MRGRIADVVHPADLPRVIVFVSAHEDAVMRANVCQPRRSLCVGRCLDLEPSRMCAHCSSGSPNRSDSRFGCAPAARRCVRARLDLALCYRRFPQIVRDPSFPGLAASLRRYITTHRRIRSMARRTRPLQIRNDPATAVRERAMSTAVLALSLSLARTLVAQDATVLLSNDLAGSGQRTLNGH
jgi:hypothetical protein